MMKLLATVEAALAVVVLGTAKAETEQVELQAEEIQWYEATLEVDYWSAYVDKNTVCNDRQTIMPYLSADFTRLDPFYLGFYVCQYWDVTDRRRGTDGTFKHSLNETDYNIHVGASVWSSDDDERNFTLELGHEWYVFQGRKVPHGEYPDTREIYLRGTYANPIIDVYGRTCWMYDDFGSEEDGAKRSLYYEIGFNREFEVAESLIWGLDWNVSFAEASYLNNCYGGGDSGFGGTTVKTYLNWAITEWFTLGGVIAYTGVLNEDSRDALRDEGISSDYRDLFWGGVSATFSF